MINKIILLFMFALILALVFFFIPTKNFTKSSLAWWSLQLSPEFSFEMLLNNVDSKELNEGVFSFSDIDGLKPQRASLTYVTQLPMNEIADVYKNRLSDKQCTLESTNSQCVSTYSCQKPEEHTISICAGFSPEFKSKQQITILVEAGR